MGTASSVEEFKQITSFQSLRKSLLQEDFAERLEKPLAYWALPSDRRLPLAFLGRTLRELLDTPFEQLAATPGIGRKKIASMLKLLARAVRQVPSKDGATGGDSADEIKSVSRRGGDRAAFDAATVSEAMWDQWRETVRRNGLRYEPLGRLAPSLQELPTVIWRAPLSTFLEYSLAELRQLKTYGEKRVRVVLEVFHSVNEVVGQATLARHLAVRVVPKFVASLENWISECIASPERVTIESVRECLAIPLVEQIHVDCGPTVTRLVEGRLGIHAPPQNVRAQSKRMGVTRARVYQLLEECEHAIHVRWPLGRCLLAVLCERERQKDRAEEFNALSAVAELFFPKDRVIRDENGA
jgi:hypothetical protein